MEEEEGHHGRTQLKTYYTEVEEGDAKTTVEQSKVSRVSQHCLPSSFINIPLEYSSTLVQRHPPTEKLIELCIILTLNSISQPLLL